MTKTLKRIAGWLIIAALVVAIFVALAVKSGLIGALVTFAIAALGAYAVWLAVNLIID